LVTYWAETAFYNTLLKQLLDELKETKYSKLKVDALDHILWIPLSEEAVDLS